MAKRRTTHKDVEYHVTPVTRTGRVGGRTFVTRSFNKAAAEAVVHALSGDRAAIDVVVYSEVGARWYGGADDVEAYRMDPDASVFQRFIVTVHNEGMVP